MRAIGALFPLRWVAMVLLLSGVLEPVSAGVVPVFSKSFSPQAIGPGSSATLTFTIDNVAVPATDLAFTDILPAGMVVANPAGVASDCVDALILAPAGGSTISVSGGRIGANAICTITVNVTAAAAGVYSNVSGDLTSSLGNSGPASADLTVMTNRPGFTKSFSPATVSLLQRSALTFTIDNLANGSAVFNLNFADDLPLGMVIAEPANLVNTCNNGTISAAPGSDRITVFSSGVNATSVCTITVDVVAEAVGDLENVSGLLSGFSITSGQIVSGFAGNTLTVTAGDTLVFSKAFIDDPVAPGGMTTLAFSIRNVNRQFSATNISFSDDLNATLSGLVAVGMPVLDVCGPGSLISGTDLITLSGGSLAPGEACNFNVTLQVPAGAVAGSYPNSTSSISADVGGSPVVNPAATDTLFVSDAPTLTKTFLQDPVGAGSVVTMRFVLSSNSTTNSTTNIAFVDDLTPFLSGTTVVAMPASGFCGAGSTITYMNAGVDNEILINGANLPATGTCTFDVDFMVPVNTPGGNFVNTTSSVTATVAGNNRVSSSASAGLTVLGPPQLRANFTDDPVLPGDIVNLNFTLSLSAEATASVTNIAFTDDLNATLMGLAALGLPLNDICGAGSQISGTTTLSFTGGSLSPGTSCSFDVPVQVPVAALPGTFPHSTSQLTGTAGGVTVTGAAATDTLFVGGLTFTKSFVDDPVIAGDTVTLEFTVSNQLGATGVTDIVFSDDLSAVLSGLTAIGLPQTDVCGTGSQLSGTTTLLLIGGNLLAGTSCTFNVTLQVPAATPNSTYTNITSSLSATVGGSPVTVEPASANLVVDNRLLTFDKAFTDDPVAPGGSVTLEYSITNTHPTDTVTDIGFSDNLDSALGGLAASGAVINDVCGTGSQVSGGSIVQLTAGTLPAAATCTFSVTVQVPAAAVPGTYTSTSDPLSGLIGGLAVSGSAASDALQVGAVMFSKSFVGPVITGQTTTLSYTINNISAAALENLRFNDDLDAALTGLTAVGLPAGNICGDGSSVSGSGFLAFDGGALAAGTSCTFDVTIMVPPGLFPGDFVSTSSELTQQGVSVAPPASATLQVLGQAFINVTPTTLDFGDIRVGDSSPVSVVTIENTGTADLNVTSLDAAQAPFSRDGGSCATAPFTLAAGNSCTLDYSFSPLVAGMVMQNLAIGSNDPGGVTMLTLMGNGLAPVLQIAPPTVDFGVVELNTVAPTQAVTLSNTGDADLNVSAVSAPALPFSEVGGSCGAAPFVLMPGANCTVSYQFSPSVVGSVSETISVQSDAASSPDSLTLQGEGAEAMVTLSTSNVNFGSVVLDSGASRSLILTNDGAVDVVISDLSGVDLPFSVLPDTCGALPITITVGASCQLELRFEPQNGGEFTDVLIITSNAAGSPDTVALRGFGSLTIAVPTLDMRAVVLLILLLAGVAVWRLSDVVGRNGVG